MRKTENFLLRFKLNLFNKETSKEYKTLCKKLFKVADTTFN